MEMKRPQKVIAWFIGVLLILPASLTVASPHYTQNEFTTAESLDAGMTQTGVNFSVGDHDNSFYAAIRYGLGAMMEVGVKLGASSVKLGSSSEDKVGPLVGIDLKYQLIKETEGIPLDMALDLGFDNTLINDKNASEVSFSTIFSKGFPLTDRGYKFTPYGGLEMSSLYGSLTDDKSTSVYVFGGLEWKLSQKFMVLLEIKAGASTVGGAGIRFEY
jgi:hypothetical protein